MSAIRLPDSDDELQRPNEKTGFRPGGSKRNRSRFPRPIADTTWFGTLVLIFIGGPVFLLVFVSVFQAISPIVDLAAQHHLNQGVQFCKLIDKLPGPSKRFHKRIQSDRYVEGTPPVLIRNATIFTMENDGKEIIHGDILLAKGIVHSVKTKIDYLPDNAIVIEANGAIVTPALVDMHSHITLDQFPATAGGDDVNSIGNPVNPQLRTIDAINTHDLALRRTVAGGVSTALILPGSANNIGGQAFAIKLRPTAEKTPDSMALEPPHNIAKVNGQSMDDALPWRHMKFACGENIKRVYQETRMDEAWNFRSAFEKARALKDKQDQYCVKARQAKKNRNDLREPFPTDLALEALVDVLRGKVKVNTHCYEATDLNAFVRHSHEFKFPIAAFHHAHEAYLVPDLLHNAYSSTPAVALFSLNGRYKREAWRGSPYASKVLHEHNITTIFKSDHPVLDSRYLLFEAQAAHHFGLPDNVALKSVITNPAVVAGFSHRLGFIRPKYDADIVLWDSHPLSMGATPMQVIIDGIPQLKTASTMSPKTISTVAPEAANTPQVAEKHHRTSFVDSVLFTNVSEVFRSEDGEIKQTVFKDKTSNSVLYQDGKFVCIGQCESQAEAQTRTVNLQQGSILPPLSVFGPALGLTEIIAEDSTSDGFVFDPLVDGDLSHAQQKYGEKTAVRAIDGLSFGGKHLQVAHESGFSRAITAPMGNSFFRGISVAFRTNAENALNEDTFIKEAVAIHVTIGHFAWTKTTVSISTQIAELRKLLLRGIFTDEQKRQDYIFAQHIHSGLPLVINVAKADYMATLVRLKREVEAERASFDGETTSLNWVIHGGQEASLIAPHLAAANISVILSPPRPFPESWDERRTPDGPPLSPENAATILERAGVKLALGVPEEWQAATLLWEAAWAAKLSNGVVTRAQTVAWLSTRLENMLGLPTAEKDGATDFVAFERDPFEFGARVIAIASGKNGKVELRL